MATRTPELQAALNRLARADSKREREAALKEVNRLRAGREPARKGGYRGYFGWGRHDQEGARHRWPRGLGR